LDRIRDSCKSAAKRRYGVSVTEETGTVAGTECSFPGCTHFTTEACSHCHKSHCDEHLKREVGRKGIHYAYCTECVKKAERLRDAAKRQRLQFTAAGALLAIGGLIVYLVSGNPTSGASLAGIGIIMMIIGITVV
jgi:hypothetical protein